ncbi:hypothetical protein GOP47_0005167 [Adiantum capillus-veneris]|uniref:E3 ubiquitin-protein ligase SHPRH n=1 Tax=Adiantum capillus-veneris TaxID=13818 RepID=A0A9D4ZL49_ADICA|nr:hypothetical protein GOP47_0005167 [Adiantum capillus-veneris]
MAKKKQSLPKRAKGSFSQAADAIKGIGDVFADATTTETAMLKIEPGSKDASNGVILYSPLKGRDSMMGLRELSIQDVRLEVLQQGCNTPGGLIANADTLPDSKVIISGYLDCSDETITAFTYLFKAGYISVRPLIRVDEKQYVDNPEIVCRLVIGVTQKSFDGCNGLLDGAKSLWSRSMLKVMRWLRPELHTDEAIYGLSENKPTGRSSVLVETDGQETEGRSQQTFDPTLLYEALRPDHGLCALDRAPPKLLAKLRPYQSRAAQWMVMKEKDLISSVQNDCDSDCRNFKWPFCLEVLSLDGKTLFYYNPFSGALSKIPTNSFANIRGGILADEMGLGKTVELLACIMTNSDRALASQRCEAAERARKELDMKLLKRKRERIACPCGACDDDHAGIWVQCDVCDVWQHASCVGFGTEYESVQFFEYQMAIRKRQAKVSNSSSAKRREFTADESISVKKEIYTIRKDFVCGDCASLIGSVEVEGVSNATLIVCPSSILGQWQEEIARHTEKGALKVIVYEGFQKGPGLQSGGEVTRTKYGKIVGAHELAMADIVLTTYNTLQADLSHDTEGEGNQPRSMRYVKRYPVVPTPLTRMTWRRVCLDEAQMVENSNARATEMAKRLNAEIRWCITGTPIQKSLDDLHGLLSFLDLQPFCDYFWWARVLREPYEKNGAGAMNFVHNYLKTIFWRSSKADVSHELGLPPQEDLLTWLTFSPVEAHFYRRQHERCATRALEVMRGNITTAKPFKDRMLSPSEVAKIMHPLLSLRQACCHPQVGSSGLRSLQKLPMTMDEVLKVLIDKAMTEGEEAQRNLVGALNGLAALKILEGDPPSAVSLYREALSIIEENGEIFDVDQLQKLHLLHNLQEALTMPYEVASGVQYHPGNQLSRKRPRDETDELLASQKLHRSDSGGSMDSMAINNDYAVACAKKESVYVPGVPRTLRDSLLGQQCQDIRTKYMASFYAKLSASQQDYSNAHSEVCAHMKDLEEMNGATWWLDVLASITKENIEGKELVKKIKNSLSERDSVALSRRGHANASSLALRFNDLKGLQYVLNRELDAIFDCRNKLVEKLSEVDELMKNPSAEDVERAGNCSQCAMSQNGRICAICEADQVYQMYENRLFMLKSTAANVGGIVSLEDAFAAQQRLLSQKRMSTLKMAAGSCGSLRESVQGSCKNEAMDIATIQVARSPSETEVILKLIKSIKKRKMDQDLIAASSKHLELLEAMRKEYSLARLVTASQRMVLLALDELNMAKTRLCLKYPGDEDSNKSGDAFIVYLEEIPQRNAQLTGEKFVALDDLRRAKGQIRYLQGLATTREKSRKVQCSASCQSSTAETLPEENAENTNKRACATGGIMEEICPVCQEHLGTQMMVFPCGHMLCCKCLMTIAEGNGEIASQRERKRIACPTCRYHTPMENIAFIDNGLGETPYSLSINKLQSKESSEEGSIDVDGSYGTKMEAVVRRILWVQASDPSSRFLVFSTWNDVLDVVEHSLSANKVAYVRAKGQRHLNSAICKFKAENEAAKVLLLLIQHGANGLNLTEAQHVILVEPLLNPSAEAQAVNRIHRIGQEHATFVHRFLIKDTVEESIYKLRQQKLNLPNQRASMGRKSNQEVAALTVKDLKMLFKDETDEPSIQTEARDTEPSSSTVNLRELPPSLAAAAAAEARLRQAQNAARSSEA